MAVGFELKSTYDQWCTMYSETILINRCNCFACIRKWLHRMWTSYTWWENGLYICFISGTVFNSLTIKVDHYLDAHVDVQTRKDLCVHVSCSCPLLSNGFDNHHLLLVNDEIKSYCCFYFWLPWRVPHLLFICFDVCRYKLHHKFFKNLSQLHLIVFEQQTEWTQNET